MPAHFLDSRNTGARMERKRIRPFREFGIPARIATFATKSKGDRLIKKWAGQKNCYVSVYAFERINGNDLADYSSAIITTLWFDFDDDVNVDNCLQDVRKLYEEFCRPKNLVPRIYYTGGRGFQINIDFEHLPLPKHIKKDAIRNYLTFLKDKYRLKTLDQNCINNSISCLRRMVNTPYIDKKTKKMNGRYCIQLSVNELLEYSMTEIEELSGWPRVRVFEIDNTQHEKAAKGLLHYVCNAMNIRYQPTNSIQFLLDAIHSGDGGFVKKATSNISEYIRPVRPCIKRAIEKGIRKGGSDHTTNTAIATELINADWKDEDIAFVFSSIYNSEPGERWGWYKDNGGVGFQIDNLKAKSINRFSKNRLMQHKICKNKICGCGK